MKATHITLNLNAIQNKPAHANLMRQLFILQFKGEMHLFSCDYVMTVSKEYHIPKVRLYAREQNDEQQTLTKCHEKLRKR